MPLYEYECPDCRARFERLVRVATASAGAACPTCGRPARRLISAFASIGLGKSDASYSSASCGPSGGG